MTLRMTSQTHNLENRLIVFILPGLFGVTQREGELYANSLM